MLMVLEDRERWRSMLEMRSAESMVAYSVFGCFLWSDAALPNRLPEPAASPAYILFRSPRPFTPSSASLPTISLPHLTPCVNQEAPDVIHPLAQTQIRGKKRKEENQMSINKRSILAGFFFVAATVLVMLDPSVPNCSSPCFRLFISPLLVRYTANKVDNKSNAGNTRLLRLPRTRYASTLC